MAKARQAPDDYRYDVCLSFAGMELAFQILAITNYAHCDECSSAALRRLDFSPLSSATLTMEAHDLHTGRRILNVGKALHKLFPLDLEESTKSGRAWRVWGGPQSRDRVTPEE
jgi:hypothetical protein